MGNAVAKVQDQGSSKPEEGKQLLVLVYRPEGSHPLLLKVESILESNPLAEVHVFQQLDTALEKVRKATHMVLLFGITKPDEIPVLSQLLSEGSRLAKKGLIRSSGFLGAVTAHPKVVNYLATQFGADILPSQIPERSFKYKINMAANVISAAYSHISQRKEVQEEGVVNYVAPIEMAEDCWIIRNTRDIAFRQTAWTLNLLGPPPMAGEWHSDSSLDANGLDAWVFKVKPDHQSLQPVPGKWVFWGKAPTFSPDTLVWLMISSAPRLVFIPESGPEQIRIETSGHTLKVAKNGPKVHEMKALIQQIMFAEKRFNNEKGERKGDFEIHLEHQIANKGPGVAFKEHRGKGGPDYHEEFDLKESKPNQFVDPRGRALRELNNIGEDDLKGPDAPDFKDSQDPNGLSLDFKDQQQQRDAKDARFKKEPPKAGIQAPLLDNGGIDPKQQSYDQVLVDMGFQLTLQVTNGAVISAQMLDLFETQLTLELDSENRLRKDQ
ncbi:MAG: hypothetical protein ACK5QT_07280 [Oligoflexia bacterium]